MSTDGRRTKWRRNLTERFNPLSRTHERNRQTDNRWTDDEITNVNVSSRSLKCLGATTTGYNHNPHPNDDFNPTDFYALCIYVTEAISLRVVREYICCVELHYLAKDNSSL